MKLNDDHTVAWSSGHTHLACSVGFAREILRREHPAWSDAEIERELFRRLVTQGRSRQTVGNQKGRAFA